MKQKVKAKSNKKNGQRRRSKRYLLLGLVGCVLLVGLGILLCKKLMPREVYYNYDSGFYDNDLEVEIRKYNDWAVDGDIRYNLNGDDLVRTSEVYNKKIKLEVPEESYKLYTITAAVCDGDSKCSEPKVETYVLGKNLKDDVTVDIISINSGWENLYDYDIGIMVGGRIYDWNKENQYSADEIGNYSRNGDAWSRDAYLAQFDVNGNYEDIGNVKIEISGNSSAKYDVKSLKVVKDGNSFRLRSGGQDQFTGNVRSSVVSRLAEEVGFDGGADTRRVVVFLNGGYYGIFDRQETFSKANLARKFGLEKKSKVERHKAGERLVFEEFGVPESVWEGLNEAEKREQLEGLVDMESYLKYYAIQILINNTDWSLTNFQGWRYRGRKEEGNKYTDGRVRFLLFDMDAIYYREGNEEYFEGTISDIFENSMERKYRGAESYFSKVMESKYYRERFMEILQEYLNGVFRTENVLQIIDEEAEKIRHQVELFSSEEEYEKWEEWIELIKKAVQEREDVVREDVWKYFGVEI